MKKIQLTIREVAREIAIGNTCYIHRYSAKVTTIDNFIEDVEKQAAQELVQTELERKISNYIKIDKLSAEDQMMTMKYFLEEIEDRSVRKQLSNALNRKNPFRNFNQAIESDMGLNQHWRNFRTEEYQRLVSNFMIEAYDE